MSRLHLAAVTLATVAVVLAGCSSDSKKTLTSPPATTANVSETPVSAAEASATTTARGDTNTTAVVVDSVAAATADTTSGSGDVLPGFSEKCKEKYASYIAKVKQLGSSPDMYKELVPLFKELLSGAPADVQAAAQPSLDAFVKFSALIDKYNGDIAKASQDPEFVAVEQSFSSADSKASSKKVEDWLKSTCGG